MAHSIDFAAGGEGTSLGKVLVFFAHLLLVFSFVGIYEAQGSQNRIVGTAGMILGICGTVIVNAIVFVEMAGITGVAVEDVFNNELNSPLHSFGPLLFVFGMIFVGLSVLKNNVLSRWGGGSLILGTIIFALGTMSGSAEALVTMIGSVVTGIGFIGLGYSIAKSLRDARLDSRRDSSYVQS